MTTLYPLLSWLSNMGLNFIGASHSQGMNPGTRRRALWVTIFFNLFLTSLALVIFQTLAIELLMHLFLKMIIPKGLMISPNFSHISYKIISKILATHLKLIIHNLVCPKQSNFLSSSSTFDNIDHCGPENCLFP